MFASNDIVPERNPSFERVKLGFAAARIIVTDPYYDAIYGYQVPMIREAARRGFLVDAGHLPDAAIRSIGERGSHMTYDRVFDHPWGDRPWLLTHTWTWDQKTADMDAKLGVKRTEEALRVLEQYGADDSPSRNMYLIEPTSNDQFFGAIVTEYMPVSIKGVSEIALIPLVRCDLTHDSPSRFRVVVKGDPKLMTPGAASSALNPMMSALMIMNTRGIGHEVHTPSEKKNEFLKRKGRPAMPGYVRLLTKDYITAIFTDDRPEVSASHSESGHDKRRSPLPHIRRGHVRHYQNGKSLWIRDMLINCATEDQLSFMERHRTAYKIQ